MHQAPPVTYPLGNVQVLRRWVLAAWVLVLTIDVLWWVQSPSQDWSLWIGLSLTVLAGACAWRFWPMGDSAMLQWDGRDWSLGEGERRAAGVLTVHLDLQSALLVFWSPASGPGTWRWLSSEVLPSQWLALRRAVFAPDRISKTQGGSTQADLAVRP
jgi:hypothetical protein